MSPIMSMLLLMRSDSELLSIADELFLAGWYIVSFILASTSLEAVLVMKHIGILLSQ